MHGTYVVYGTPERKRNRICMNGRRRPMFEILAGNNKEEVQR